VALLLDELLGEPPTRVHPVVGMGAYLDAVAPLVPAAPPVRAVATGGLAWAAGLVAVTGLAAAGDRGLGRLPVPVAVLLRGTALWTVVSGRLLRREVAAVEAALARSLQEGRDQVGRLVSRDVTALDAEQVRAAALGSLSENLCDSVVAPLLAHAVAGVPGAVAYRFANTADAMWGYRSARWQHAGRVAARADDLANLLPARLTGLLLLGPRRLLAGGGRSGPARLRAQARLTPSPNGGWPMGALALRLGIRLTKPGVYDLNPDGRPATAQDTAVALRRSCMITAVVGAAAVLGVAAAGLNRDGHGDTR